MVKDLWALRLQLLQSKIGTTYDKDTTYSSQPQSETETESRDDGVGRKSRNMSQDMPTLIETLGLCYMGTILLRLPVSMGEIHRYVTWCLFFRWTLAKTLSIPAGLSEKTFLS